MPSNLRDYMNKNNISNSARDSQNQSRPVMIEESRIHHSKNDNHGRSKKFMNSKSQCADELTRILGELDRKDDEIKRISEGYNVKLIKKFNEQYDNYAQQIIKTVENHLRENKQRILGEIKERRNLQMAETKPIRRNVQKLRDEVSGLRDGLYRDSEYREYISRIVLRDYDNEIDKVQIDIDRVRFPEVELRLDQKYYNCFKSDTNKIIVVRDEMMNRFHSDSAGFGNKGREPSQHNMRPSKISQHRYEDINPHPNRDDIKRSAPNKY